MPMANKNEVATNANPTKQSASKAKLPKKDPRDPIQYAIDRGFDAAGNELDRMEQERPGTRRKLAGALLIGAGLGSATAGVYLFTS